MTTYSKVKQTLIDLKSAQSTMEHYAKITQDEKSRKIFERSARKLEPTLERLNKRIQRMEFEEPQYKGS
ncbi:uncharacterized protein DUF1657 [Melghirimyces profundicolus]|mgnify:CR=1 FL=1|uniref:Uncharacterized protein DUF1657 n=1 Tax=Melghirimyces profundicolus TaxID=1242148 RepID=A0A2T6C7F7_9BACL|nr:DUF1657 domain-containing protein [Melghirimyces profundicolus]PTX64258.1 uncharacterized protein DUF1657 [Melghirimyces profundicolus]